MRSRRLAGRCHEMRRRMCLDRLRVRRFQPVAAGGFQRPEQDLQQVQGTRRLEAVRMGGFATGNQNSKLTAESTALFLVRLALVRPDDVNSGQMNSYIKSAADFALLTQQVTDAIAVGQHQTIPDRKSVV